MDSSVVVVGAVSVVVGAVSVVVGAVSVVVGAVVAVAVEADPVVVVSCISFISSVTQQVNKARAARKKILLLYLFSMI